MAGLINSNILRNPKIPLNRITAQPAAPAPGAVPHQGSVAVTGQALTKTPAPFSGEYIDPFGNSHLPGEPGYPAQPVPGSGFGEERDAQGNSYLPGEPGHSSSSPGGLDGAMTSPAPASFDWDMWANTPWNDEEASQKWEREHPAQRVDLTPGNEHFVTPAAGSTPNVAATSGNAGDRDWQAWANTPWSEQERLDMEAKNIGSRETPGQGEDVGDKEDLGNDDEMRAVLDMIMARTQMSKPNLDPWYDREWQRASGDLNRQAGARGMFGSSDAQRMLHQSRESLAADQAKEMADYETKAFENDMSRYGLASSILGKVSDNDMKRWDLFQGHKETAQTLEERRKQDEFDNLFKAGQATSGMTMDAFKDMTDDDMKMFLQIVQAGPAPSTNKANLEAQASEKAKAAAALFFKLQAGGA